MIEKIWQGCLAFITILILGLIVTRVYFHDGFPYTHDGENHLARFANYKVALREGQFPPRFAPNLMNRYGYPVFNYNYPLANLLSLPFSVAGVNYEQTFKIIASCFVIFGFWGLWRWLTTLKIKLGAKLFGLSLFALAPYLTNLIFYRGNLGELMALSIFPWLLFLIEKLKTRNFKLIEVLLVSAFLLAHNVTVMFGLPLVIFYALLRKNTSKKMWGRLIKLLLWSIALSLWFWLPAVAEKNLVNVGQVDLITTFKQHFPTLKQLIFAPLSFGFSYPAQTDNLSFSLGLGLVGSIFLALILWLKKIIAQRKKSIQRSLWLLASLLTVLLIIFQLSFTQFIWQIVPLAAFIQFPWRLSLFLTSFGTLLAALVWQKIGRGARYVLLFLLTIQLGGQLQAQPVDYFHRQIIDYDAFSQSTTTQNENLPRNFTYQEISDWQPTATILEGQAEVNIKNWTGSKRSYQLKVSEEALIVEPTMNFAGWETIIQDQSGQKKQVSYLNQKEIGGRIAYQLEPGEYQVQTKFTQKTWPRLLGNSLSLMGILIWLFLFIKKIFGKKFSFYVNLKLGLLWAAFSAGLISYYQPSFPYVKNILKQSNLPQWLYSWANFDGVHYLTIAQSGYLGTGLIQAFFPLWPKILTWGQNLGFSAISFGLIVNLLLGWSLLKKWFKLLKIDLGKKTAWWGVLALFLFPTAFFFQALYSETLFLWLVISSFYAARRQNWWSAGLFAGLASATRIVGIMMWPALIIELIDQVGWPNFKNNLKDYRKQLVAIMLSTVGLGSYMFYLWQNFNDPLYFFHVQAEFGGGRQEKLILYPQVVWRYLKILTTTNSNNFKYLSYLQEFLAGFLGLLGTLFAWFKVRKSYVVFSFLALITPTLTGTFSSLPRYILVCPVIFVLLAQLLADKKWFRFLWLPLSIGLLIINTMLFIQGRWVA